MKTSFTIQAHPFHLVEPSPWMKNSVNRIFDHILYFKANNYFSTQTSFNSQHNSLHPFFVTGLYDAEACFQSSIPRTESFKLNWQVRAIFIINLHCKDLPILASRW